MGKTKRDNEEDAKALQLSYFKEVYRMISESSMKIIPYNPQPSGFVPSGGVDLTEVTAGQALRFAPYIQMSREFSVITETLKELQGRSERTCDSYRRGGKFFCLTEKETIYSGPLDTETQWFVMPKDLKETSGGKTIGYQGERAGWSSYEDD